MNNFKLVETRIEVDSLLKKLETMPELWNEITIRQEYSGSAHHDTETIFLRGPKTLTPEDYFGDLGSINYPAMKQLASEIFPVIFPAMKKLKYTELGRMMIVKLKPHGVVDAHIDEGNYADHFSRFHIVLQTTKGAVMGVGDESCHMRAGECWWFNHKVLHAAHNMSDVPRIHLIFDAVSPIYPMER